MRPLSSYEKRPSLAYASRREEGPVGYGARNDHDTDDQHLPVSCCAAWYGLIIHTGRIASGNAELTPLQPAAFAKTAVT